jgi:competence protein ComEC
MAPEEKMEEKREEKNRGVVPGLVSRKAQIVRSALLSVLIMVGAWIYLGTAAYGRGAEGELSVTFLDIGQGDAIFIESPTGVQMLIDGGPPDGGVLARLSERMGFFDRSLDIVLATHPDQDHIGGLPSVLDRYDVGEILMTENKGETLTFKGFFQKVADEGTTVTYVRRGMRYDLGDGAILTILFPDRDPMFLESNTSSIVARLVYGDAEFLFTGDSPQAIEDHLVMLDRGSPESELHSDVLKAGHHGSRTSSSPLFLDAVRPTYAIISSGKNNKYGHPHKETLEALAKIGAEIKNTADEGSITIVSDGSALWQE